jgi:UDP-N-acetylglucosamine 2-epimerase
MPTTLSIFGARPEAIKMAPVEWLFNRCQAQANDCVSTGNVLQSVNKQIYGKAIIRSCASKHYKLAGQSIDCRAVKAQYPDDNVIS